MIVYNEVKKSVINNYWMTHELSQDHRLCVVTYYGTGDFVYNVVLLCKVLYC